MSTTTNPFRPAVSPHLFSRNLATILVLCITTIFAFLAMSFLFYLIFYLAQQGIQYLSLDFITQDPQPIGGFGGGVRNAIVGSVIVVAVASLIGIPLGLFTGIYLAEFKRGPLSSTVRFMVDMLTGIPSIIFGLFIWALVVAPTRSFSGLAGGLALSVIMIPTVTRATEEVLRLVPKDLREASAALGATKSRTIMRVVLPSTISGIMTGIFLAIARVTGETAPLLLTAFGNPFYNADPTLPIATLPQTIFEFAKSPYDEQIHQAYTGSFVLMVLVILALLAIRWATGGFKRR
jgi:phosphate transport system permease protein